MSKKIDWEKVPVEDVSKDDLWVVAKWSGNSYTGEGSWVIYDGLYWKEETALMAASVQGINKNKVMTLTDFIYRCNE